MENVLEYIIDITMEINLGWGYQHIFQYDGTIEWKATEQSDGASKGFLRVVRCHLPMHWKLRYGTLLMVPQAKLSYGCAR